MNHDPRRPRAVLSTVPILPADQPMPQPVEPVSPSLRLEVLALTVVTAALDQLAPEERRMVLRSVNKQYGDGS